MEFECKKCGCKNYFTKASGQHVGLYCMNGHWQKWLNKEESLKADKDKNNNNDKYNLLKKEIQKVRDTIRSELLEMPSFEDMMNNKYMLSKFETLDRIDSLLYMALKNVEVKDD